MHHLREPTEMAEKWPENGQKIPGISGSLTCVMGSAGFQYQTREMAGRSQWDQMCQRCTVIRTLASGITL